MREELKPNPTSTPPEQAAATQRMDVFTKYLAHESALFWSRSQFFLAANAGLFGLLAIAFRDPVSTGTVYHFFLLTFACVLGLALTILWFRVLASGGWWMAYWMNRVQTLEGCAFGDFKAFRGCSEARKQAGAPSSMNTARFAAVLFLVVWILSIGFSSIKLVCIFHSN